MTPLPLGIYQHYKGNKYEVIDFAIHSETNEDMVIYRALKGDDKKWVRPLSMWGNPIDINGRTLMRFEYIAGSSDMIDFIDVKTINDNIDKINVGLEKYNRIMDSLCECNVSEDMVFQKLFKGFYRVRRNDEFCRVYFSYMEKNKNNIKLTFGDVLAHIHSKTNRLEPSFSSKLLATINPNAPVWDSHVLSQLSIEPPHYKDDNRLQAIIETYSDVEKRYDNYMTTQNAKEAITRFDKLIPNTQITDIKKIDLVLWSMGKKE